MEEIRSASAICARRKTPERGSGWSGSACPSSGCWDHVGAGSGSPESVLVVRVPDEDVVRVEDGAVVVAVAVGEGLVVEVIDRGGAIKGDKLDVYFPTHARARQWGRQMVPVQILEPIEPAAGE